MSKKFFNSRIFFVIIAVLQSLTLTAAEAEISQKPVVMAFQVERLGGFLAEPGNFPIEALRRFGRAVNKDWAPETTSFQAASILDISTLATPDFLKPIKTDLLTTDQKNSANKLLEIHSKDFNSLLADCHPASEAITIKTVCESKSMKEALQKAITNPATGKRIESDQLYRIENQIMPILESSDYLVGAMIISAHGLFARFNVVSHEGKLDNSKLDHDLTIGDFINENSLMFFAQTHPIENPAETFENIKAVPQSGMVLQMVASAGLDFEKDLLGNSARESILYVNLEPTGDGGLPDIRFAAPVPEINKLRDNLAKLKQLCVQTGIFAQTIDEKFSLVKLSYFMFPQVAVYAGLAENFLVIATAQKNLVNEISHILDIKSGKKKGAKIFKGLKRFWKIKFTDFNLQLQRLLQSPIFRDKGIPPVSNLKFLEDISELEILTKSSPEKIEFILDMPIAAITPAQPH
ncbi:MAG: hypothetical protein EOM80_12125 [Erysipelotrichia bacterium]|nr:hypothetical protein [Erysipelotrichia bacterium]